MKKSIENLKLAVCKMIYSDLITYYEKRIVVRTKRIESLQTKSNKFWKLQKSGEFIETMIRETQRLQIINRRKINEYKSEVREIKRLQDDNLELTSKIQTKASKLKIK